MKLWQRGLRRWAHGVGFCLAVASSLPASAGTLNVQFGVTDNAQRQALTAMVEQFKAANRDVDVHLTLTDFETYRARLPASLSTDAAPDVFNWFAGDEMHAMANQGLLEDLSDLWKTNAWTNSYGPFANASQVGGKFVGLPYQYYAWGLFFRHDVLERVGLANAPRDFAGMLTACSKLSHAGFIPIALNAKDGWAIAAWFDYVDMRTNGAAFHQDLTGGQVSYLDGNVRRSFMMWRQLVDAKCFAPDAVNTDFRGARALLYQGHAGMILAGTTFSATVPPVLKDIVDYARFPTIDPAQSTAEAAPTDTFHIAARGHDKADARRFLQFVASSAVNGQLARAMGSFPANKFAPVQGTVLDLKAYKVLTDAKGGLVQAYDRDVPAAMASKAIAGMQEFLVHPEKMYPILTAMDAARAGAYHPVVAEAPPATGRRR